MPQNHRQLIEDQLRQPARWLNFQPVLEHALQQDIHDHRRQHIFVSHVIAFFIFISFLFWEWFMIPDVFALAVSLKAGVVSALNLACIGLLRRTRSTVARELYAAVPCVVAAATGMLVVMLSNSPDRGLLIFGLPLILVYANNTVALPFRLAVPTTALIVAMIMLCTFQVRGNWFNQLFCATLTCVTAVFSLLANYWLERSERRNYLLGAREKQRNEELLSSNLRLRQLSDTDALTGQANRRGFDQHLLACWLRYEQAGEDFALILMDVDHFKAYNDVYGHPAGDACLQRIAQTLRDTLRQQDTLARYGGEEFAVLLPAMSPAQAQATAQRLREAVFAEQIAHLGRTDTYAVVTLSLGSACASQLAGGEAATLLEKADRAMYQAKHEGRNRAVIAGEAGRLHVFPPMPLGQGYGNRL